MEEEMTIAEIVAANASFSLLGTALETAGLTEAVADPEATLTVFAPTNDAFVVAAQAFGYEGDPTDEDAVFAALVDVLTDLAGGGDPIPLLQSILLYHVVPSDLSLAEVGAADALATLETTVIIPAGDTLIDASPERVDPMLIEGLTDIGASNGTIHAVDGILLPINLPATGSELNIVEQLVGLSSDEGFDDDATDFDILIAAVTAAGLGDALSDPEADFTVFAPNDQAFIDLATALGAEVTTEEEAFDAIVAALTGLAEDDDPLPILTDILTYHVATENLSRVAIAEAESLTTVFGDGPTPGPRTLGDAEPDLPDPAFIDENTDFFASNGIIQPIDGVLLPFALPDPEPEPTLSLVGLLLDASSDEGFDDDATDFDVLIAAVTAAGLVDVLDDPEADFTVVAPNDQAFIDLAVFLGASPASEEEAFDAIVAALTGLAEDDDPIPLLTDILTFHVFTESLTRAEIAEAESITTVFGPGPVPGAETLGDEEPNLPDPAFIDAASDLLATNGIAHAIDGVLLPFALPDEGGGEGVLVGTDGDDEFDIDEVTVSIDGLAGDDTANVPADIAETAIAPAGEDEDGFVLTIGEQTIALVSVENLIFSDAAAVLSDSATAASIVRLYDNGLGVDADIPGASFWTDVAESQGLDFVSDFFADTFAFESLYGTAAQGATFVSALYTGILEREADDDGLAFWTDALENGIDEGDILLAFSDSAEAVAADANLVDEGVFLLA